MRTTQGTFRKHFREPQISIARFPSKRLELMFPGEARVEVIETPEHFLVTLSFPAAGPPE